MIKYSELTVTYLRGKMEKQQITDNEIVRHKKNAIKCLNNLFETFINSSNPKHKKKANLIAYWIEAYSKYLIKEERFDYSSIPKFKRGDVILINFGFNIGSEHGGLHYAIVLDNDNKQSSPVITVIPLSSGDQESVHDRDVFLGNELYDKLKNKYNKLITDTEVELPNAAALEVYAKEISKLKTGSIALMEQITTVSKMRIYKPKTSSDLLHGIKFSNDVMDKINERLKELYVYSKKG